MRKFQVLFLAFILLFVALANTSFFVNAQEDPYESENVIVQWDADKMNAEIDLSPEDSVRYSQRRVEEQVASAGFVIDRIETFLPVQKLYVCSAR